MIIHFIIYSRCDLVGRC